MLPNRKRNLFEPLGGGLPVASPVPLFADGATVGVPLAPLQRRADSSVPLLQSPAPPPPPVDQTQIATESRAPDRKRAAASPFAAAAPSGHDARHTPQLTARAPRVVETEHHDHAVRALPFSAAPSQAAPPNHALSLRSRLLSVTGNLILRNRNLTWILAVDAPPSNSDNAAPSPAKRPSRPAAASALRVAKSSAAACLASGELVARRVVDLLNENHASLATTFALVRDLADIPTEPLRNAGSTDLSATCFLHLVQNARQWTTILARHQNKTFGCVYLIRDSSPESLGGQAGDEGRLQFNSATGGTAHTGKRPRSEASDALSSAITGETTPVIVTLPLSLVRQD